MNDNYSAVSGQGIYAGRYNVPSWIAGAAINTWGTVPATNLLSSLDPKLDPLINPNFPSNPEWYASNFAGIASAWCGWVYDYINHRLRTGLGGGHADYAGNDEYGINLKSDSPSWYRMRLPSGAIGNLLTTDDSQEATGNYADGQPRAIHSYNKQVFVPNIGLVVAVQGNTSWSGQAGLNRPLFYNHDGLFTGVGATNTNVNGATSGAGACYDPTRHCIYVMGTNSGRLQKYDITTNTWSQLGNSFAWSGSSALEYIEEHDCLLWFNAFLSNGFAVIDLADNTMHFPSVTGSYVGGMAKPRGQCQPRRVKAGEYAFWDNDSSTIYINKLSYSGNPKTATWVASQYNVAAGNSIMPTVRTTNGTYGRFFIDTEFKIMGVINAVNQPIYFYRYE